MKSEVKVQQIKLKDKVFYADAVKSEHKTQIKDSEGE